MKLSSGQERHARKGHVAMDNGKWNGLAGHLANEPTCVKNLHCHSTSLAMFTSHVALLYLLRSRVCPGVDRQQAQLLFVMRKPNWTLRHFHCGVCSLAEWSSVDVCALSNSLMIFGIDLMWTL